MKDIVVLCYHAVSEQWPSELAVTPANLERQLGHLVQRGYRGATFTAAVTTVPAAPTVVVTFDDAYRSVATLAAPILARLRIPGTAFVPTAFIGRGEPMSWRGIEEWKDGPWADELLPMNERELRELADAGWEIGSHTHSHPRLTELDDAELRGELEQSRTICEQLLGQPCTALAYPYGDYDPRVVRAAAAAGYRSAATLPAQLTRPVALSWPRVYVTRFDDTGRFSLKVYRPVRWVRSTRLWGGVEAARRRRMRSATSRGAAS